MKSKQRMKYGYQTASPDIYILLKENAKAMRQAPTEAENYLWRFLSSKKLGVKFRRQHILGDFIVDFVSFKAKIVIEVDGGYHNEENQKLYDANRTAYLNRLGFKVLRFPNDFVINDIDKVISVIQENITRTIQ